MGYFSNGTEGMAYEERYCERCIHSEAGRGAGPGEVPPCPVWMAHLLWAYELCNEDEHPGKQMLDMLIPRGEREIPGSTVPFPVNEQCTMFVARPGLEVPGQMELGDAP